MEKLKNFHRKRFKTEEWCYYIDSDGQLTRDEISIIFWLLQETFEPDSFGPNSFMGEGDNIVEIGRRLDFTSPFSTNAVAICHSCKIKTVKRIERSRIYKIPDGVNREDFIKSNCDRMTELVYPKPLTSFETGIKPEPVIKVRLIEEGISALKDLNDEIGLGMDDWDIKYYYDLFVNDIGRNPTNVECFQLGQSNSEHSRHWFFKGKLKIDGEEIKETLMEILSRPLKAKPGNSIIAFNDNSSSIKGYGVRTIIPEKPGKPSRFIIANSQYDIIFTAETHNFPSGVAPFPGAETGTGGRIRDVEATGRGGLVVAGTAAYCVGNLQIPDYELPWEDKTFVYPNNLASPLEIEIQASNGASDYGNKFGEPVIQGFTRSFGLRLPNGERREWLKPIMFTGGVGQMDARHAKKGKPKKGMLIVQLGGPAYRIGVGGGAASSMVQGENLAHLDFNAVQRGDAEMEQKMNRVIRVCIEMGENNPIISAHDQGAGGPCNIVTELVEPAGGRIEIRNIQVGDKTLSVLEIWGAEYQERNGLLIKPERYEEFEAICAREKVKCEKLGEITGDGHIIVHDREDDSTPVNLDLKKILAEMPQKTYEIERVEPVLKSLELPADLSVRDALDKVLRLLSVGSKRFLTNKVDRSVTGLISQQQCVGRLQLPLSNVAVVAQSHFGLTGAAISIGEQPIKGLISPAAMGRMSLGEALTNIVWVRVSALEDIKISGNWMWAAKYPGERVNIYDTAVAVSDLMTELGIALDGGKDSMSMAAMVGKEVVKSPGTFVVSAYVTVSDITKVITPDIKKPGESVIYFIDFGGNKNRLGGSALAHVYEQIGNESPDVDDVDLLKRAFLAIQKMIDRDLILSGHDRSDGGLITTFLEMGFSGIGGLHIKFKEDNMMAKLFSEELGLVLEVLITKKDIVSKMFDDYNVPHRIIGHTVVKDTITITNDKEVIFHESLPKLRDDWEETSYQLERLQCNPKCAEEEKKVNFDRKGPTYKLSFEPEDTLLALIDATNKPKIAIIREEGSNSDREMTSAFYAAGFEPWDITMTDFLEERITLERFRGIAFVGGFSYADVLDSAKGWAGAIRFNKKIWEQFQAFYERDDTFSLGVCNGCQLMALLGWVPWQGLEDKFQPRFIKNISNRFESRWSTVKILPSPSIMLKEMEGSALGIWVAHGEGRLYIPDDSIIDSGELEQNMPIRYVDDDEEITMRYPFNPNGSFSGAAALCSPDGRHLAIMPHPERSFLTWQWPWMPEYLRSDSISAPWLKMFQNARIWCEETKK